MIAKFGIAATVLVDWYPRCPRDSSANHHTLNLDIRLFIISGCDKLNNRVEHDKKEKK
jgi:hypothetical protein